jgi:hypothetical protein
MGALEKLLGHGPDTIEAAVVENTRVTRVLAGGRWRPAPEGMVAADLSPSTKLYQGIDPDAV